MININENYYLPLLNSEGDILGIIRGSNGTEFYIIDQYGVIVFGGTKSEILSLYRGSMSISDSRGVRHFIPQARSGSKPTIEKLLEFMEK